MNGFLLVYKEKEMTSHDLVNIVRRSLRTKRVGHTGTLDPNATGLMVVAINKATKLVNYLQNDDKEYIFEMKFGVSTDTLDIWGTVTKKQEVKKVLKDEFISTLESFLGETEQIPPMYSAIKVNGRKLYELARNNETIEIKPRKIIISEIELLEFDEKIKVRVVCSSGTYIRSLIRDIALKTGNLGVMTELIRTRVGNFKVEDAISIEDVRERKLKLLDSEIALETYYKIEYNDQSDIYNGRRIELDTDENLVLITLKGKSVAFYEREKDNVFKCKRGLW